MHAGMHVHVLTLEACGGGQSKAPEDAYGPLGCLPRLASNHL